MLNEHIRVDIEHLLVLRRRYRPFERADGLHLDVMVICTFVVGIGIRHRVIAVQMRSRLFVGKTVRGG